VQHKDMVCSLGTTRVVKAEGQVDRISVVGSVNCTDVPKLKEPVPHIQFGKKAVIGSPLPQPVLVVKVTVDPEFYKMAGLRVPSAKNLKSVKMKMKLTADTGAQVVTCNVDKLSGLGLRRKDQASVSFLYWSPWSLTTITSIVFHWRQNFCNSDLPSSSSSCFSTIPGSHGLSPPQIPVAAST